MDRHLRLPGGALERRRRRAADRPRDRVAPSEDASRPFAALIDCPGCRQRHLIRPSWRKLNPDEPQHPDLTLPVGLKPGRNPHNPYRSRAAA